MVPCRRGSPGRRGRSAGSRARSSAGVRSPRTRGRRRRREVANGLDRVAVARRPPRASRRARARARASPARRRRRRSCARRRSLQPWTTFSPTPPQPTTATVSPGRTRAVLSAAPTPVMTAHPISASSRQRERRIDRDRRPRRARPTARRTTTCCSGGSAARLAVEAARTVLQGRVVPGDVLAAVRQPARALAAAAAVRKPRQHHVIAGLDVRDARPDLLDDPGALVAEDRPATTSGGCPGRRGGPSGTRRLPPCGRGPRRRAAGRARPPRPRAARRTRRARLPSRAASYSRG